MISDSKGNLIFGKPFAAEKSPGTVKFAPFNIIISPPFYPEPKYTFPITQSFYLLEIFLSSIDFSLGNNIALRVFRDYLQNMLEEINLTGAESNGNFTGFKLVS